MGDTGSLALGGALAALAVFTKTELLLPLIGGVFVVEALSVIIQVISFQRFGRRVFLMAPIHHHFEMKAWSETKIIVRFWIVAAICAGAAFVLVLPAVRPVHVMDGLGAACVVLGAARSGIAAAEALGRCAAGRAGRARRSQARCRGACPQASKRCSVATTRAARGVDLLVKSPGVPARRPASRAARARPGSRSGARSSSAYRLLGGAQPDRRRHRNQRQDHHHAAARPRCSSGGGVPSEVAGNVGTALSTLVGRHRARRGDRLRALELPARGRRRASAPTSRCCST